MKSELSVKIIEYGYQRNGIGGEGFFYFLISFKSDNGKTRRAIATLINDTDKNGEYPEKFNGSCRVITPNNLADHWRGDNFEYEIRKLHKEWYKYSEVTPSRL